MERRIKTADIVKKIRIVRAEHNGDETNSKLRRQQVEELERGITSLRTVNVSGLYSIILIFITLLWTF